MIRPRQHLPLTQQVLARRMIDRTMSAGVPAQWVTADAVYGSIYHFRAAVEGHANTEASDLSRGSASAERSQE
jgi:SRSO17 transposase